jgi:hypothetical protein
MSTNISPVRILGRWQAGFALDYHIVSSTYIRDDEFGPRASIRCVPRLENWYID